ncbi:EAL domain-containing protein [Aliidiomarina halalkaliphila]|uniref:EAL domain-containing protein n=1 Tax=Aliidiomarina halalkaliphila TaxID=2593535 RepID=A0A552X0D4_9GAMM|nr:EAL domain-containing protein [Aliidiomarina halalkaliphila]TRW48396.1 EAL domain-containing protein [Aliidiomarina halalkaliphila]
MDIRRLYCAGILSFLILTNFGNAHADTGQERENPITKLTFAGSKFYPPLQWLTSDNRPQGFITDLEQYLAEQGGFAIQQNLLPWNEALDSVLNGKADAIALIPSEERSKVFDFSAPFHYVAHGIFSHRSGVQYGNLEQLSGRTVSVAAGSFAAQKLHEESPPFEIINARDELHCLQLVHDRTADACIEADVTSRRLASLFDLDVVRSSAAFWPQSYAFAVKKGNQDVLDLINAHLALAQVNGGFSKVYNHWAEHLESQDRTFTDNLKALGWLVTLISVLALLGFLWSYALKKQVARKTAQIKNELNERICLQERLKYLSRHDVITGIYNRPAFTDSLDQQLQRDPNSHPVVVVVRITNIDSITSVFGYTVVNALLQEFSERLKKDGFQHAAHFGGGVFAVVAHSKLSNEEIVALAQQPLEFNSLDFEPLLTFGIHRSRPDTAPHDNAHEMLRKALTAVSKAQQTQEVFIEYDVTIEPNADDLRLLKDFHRDGMKDFFLVYQPKLDVKTGLIKGAEALLRWQHPKLGLVSPAKFIPLLEESGMITEVTQWVIHETISMIRRRGVCGKGIVVSINVSTRDLTDLGFVQFVEKEIKNIDPKCIQFEITETGFIDDSDRALYALTKITEMGIGCSVDDFGTGNSSLSYLSKFPVGEIKLDRSFVFDITKNARHLTIVSSTIELAHTLGLSVTAEGVEDKDTVELLRELKCETIQGYVISRPIAEDEILEMFFAKSEH